MNDLKEIGGFIVSGDPLVYADSATMTGQGTVSEPFGVKSTDLFVQEPLYTGISGNSAYIGWNNETLLWSGTSTVLNQTFNLSESLSNFKKIRFKHCFEGSGVFAPTFTDYDSIAFAGAGQGIGLSYNGCKAQNDLAGWNFGLANIVRVSDTQLSGRGAGYFALNAKSLITSNIYYIYGIYGVDRISGSN